MSPAAVNDLLLSFMALLTLLFGLSLVAIFQMPPWIANPLNRAARNALDELETQFAEELLEGAAYTARQIGRKEIDKADIQAECQKRRRSLARNRLRKLIPISRYGGITLAVLEAILYLYEHRFLPPLPPGGERLIPGAGALVLGTVIVRDVTEFVHDRDGGRREPADRAYASGAVAEERQIGQIEVSPESVSKSAARESSRCSKRLARDVRKQARATRRKTGRAGRITPKEIRTAWWELVIPLVRTASNTPTVPAAPVSRSRAAQVVAVLTVTAIIYFIYELLVTRHAQGAYLSAGLIAAALVILYLALAYGLFAVNFAWRRRQGLFDWLRRCLDWMRRKGPALVKRFPRIRRKVIASGAGSASPAGNPTEVEKEGTMSNDGPQGTSGRFSWLKHTTTWLVILALGMLVGGTIWIFIYAFTTPGSHWSYVAVGMLTALTAVLVGFFAGFLIGIPRVVSSGQARLSTDRFSPSTNLAEISDWLTKLLLGAGLVSLSRLGGPIGKLIDNVAGGLHGVTINPSIIQAAKVTAGTIMIAFSVLGLLVGYIVTSTWYERRLQETFPQERTGEGSQQNPSGTPSVTGTTGTPPPL